MFESEVQVFIFDLIRLSDSRQMISFLILVEFAGSAAHQGEGLEPRLFSSGPCEPLLSLFREPPALMVLRGTLSGRKLRG